MKFNPATTAHVCTTPLHTTAPVLGSSWELLPMELHITWPKQEQKLEQVCFLQQLEKQMLLGSPLQLHSALPGTLLAGALAKRT